MFDYEQESEIERMLKDDIREQKRTGNGIHGRASRLRKHESVRTPSESLVGIEKKIVMNAGVIITTTIGEMKMNELLTKVIRGEIPPKVEFEALDFDDCQKATAELRRLHTNAEIMREWKIASQSLSNFFFKMQVDKIKGGQILIGQSAIDFINKGRKTRGMTLIGEENNQEEKVKRPYHKHIAVNYDSDINDKNVKEIDDKSVTSTTIIEPINVVEVNNALINIKRKFNTLELENFLQRLSMFLSEDHQEYFIELKVTEIIKKE